MKIDIITIECIGSALLSVAFIIWICIKSAAAFEFDEDPIPDDMPGHYDDYELSERPYIEML